MSNDTVTALRRKFMVVVIVALVAALSIIFVTINVWNHTLATERVDSVIAVLHEHDGHFPDKWKKENPGYVKGTFEATSETPFETRYLVAWFDANHTVTDVDATHIAEFDEDTARDTVETILERHRSSGYFDRYRYRIYTEEDGGGMVIAIDCFQQLKSAGTLIAISAAVVGATVITTLVFIVPLSRRVVDPYVRNLERQKRFVTDASHELKTPIAIIAANTDLIEATEGASSWTQSTRTQTERLTKLTGELIELARADAPIERESRVDVNVAEVVMQEIEDFIPLAEASGKQLDLAVEGASSAEAGAGDAADTKRTASRIVVSGRPEELNRLVSVLIENAVKYCDEAGTIRVRLWTRRRDVVLTVSNPCKDLDPRDTRFLFDRFYRTDASRSRSTGGYGIGLSIAKSIATRHGGTIRAKKVGDDLEMRVVLPRA